MVLNQAQEQTDFYVSVAENENSKTRSTVMKFPDFI